ncbi:MAG: aconitate hydratase [Planctomycetes bacterium]|nr:aconitate hydratase [Planctomycetota bacterium]
MARRASTVRLTPGRRVLFLTRDPDLIRRQLRGEIDLTLDDVSPGQLLDDVNTDAMTPAWVCFDHRPEEIAVHAYAGLTVKGERLFPPRALMEGGFEVIVSGERKGVGSSRETAVQAEKWSGIRIAVAASFAPIHARNNVNQGVLMAGYDVLRRLMRGEGVLLDEFTRDLDPVTRMVVEQGGLFPFSQALAKGEVRAPVPKTARRAMTMAEKIIARHLIPEGSCQLSVAPNPHVKPGDAVMVTVDAGYSHEFTTAQVHYFLQQEYGPGYRVKNPERFAVFEDHLIFAEEAGVYTAHMGKIETLRRMQREFQAHTGVRDYNAAGGRSPGICHEVAREQFIDPGDFVQATDSHTCMGGSNGALAFGVGATEYAALLASGFTFIETPESIRFELTGAPRAGVTAKDLMLFILWKYARQGLTLNRVMEFGGPGLSSFTPDERATLANMATECSARAGLAEVDDATLAWMAARRPGASIETLRRKAVAPDPGAEYGGGVHAIDLSALRPMVAHPGDPDRGVPSDPTNGALVAEIGRVKIDIAYGGSCTAGKRDDIDMYARVMREALRAGRRVAPGVEFIIQFGSEEVARHAREAGHVEVFEKCGVRLIAPGCGACIGCGPGMSLRPDQVTVSAINRNYRGRSGPGRLYLASPLTVAASAVTGVITAYEEGMFAP